MGTFIDRSNADFTCKYCGIYVTSHSIISGVNHRNHCPSCLYSRHLDLYQAGDRLCACRGMMAPVGLTTKSITDKYNRNAFGELMLVHYCLDCGAFSINRIAADDDNFTLLSIFETSLSDYNSFRQTEKLHDIDILREEDRQMVESRLLGSSYLILPDYVCA